MIRKAIVTASTLIAVSAAAPAAAGDVTIVLTNVRPDAGDLMVTLQTRDQFMRSGEVAGEVIENPQDGTVTVTFEDLPDGEYAMMAWHDTDGDGNFSMGPMGPTDGWSMIGASELRGMPSWEAQSFTLDGDATLTEAMLYPRDGR